MSSFVQVCFVNFILDRHLNDIILKPSVYIIIHRICEEKFDGCKNRFHS